MVGRATMIDVPPPAFRVVSARAKETPLVVEVPHAGLQMDAPSLATLQVPARCLAEDADLYVDELFAGAIDEGATMLVASFSRYVLDLNREETGYDGVAVEGSRGATAPHGLVWHRSTGGLEVLRQPLDRNELQRRLTQIYQPYHAKLRELLLEKKARFGYAILLCAHSMPSRGRDGHGHVVERADLVPGTRGRTSTHASLLEVVDDEARHEGFSVAHDDPYRGGYSTAHYGDPSRRVHAFQLELARRLYMSEITLLRDPKPFDRTRAFCRRLAARLGSSLFPL